MMLYMRKMATILAIAILIWGVAAAMQDSAKGQGKSPRPAEKELNPQGDLQPGPHDRCPVCGMFPAKRPKTAAAMQLADGRTFYFCGNSCLLRSVRDSRVHLNLDVDQIERLRVRDYFSGGAIDGRQALWVAGSDVIGPMGPALVTLQSEADLEVFRRRHGGNLTFRLDQVDDALWQQIFPARNS
jgi:copper chaperone NosL